MHEIINNLLNILSFDLKPSYLFQTESFIINIQSAVYHNLPEFTTDVWVNSRIRCKFCAFPNLKKYFKSKQITTENIFVLPNVFYILDRRLERKFWSTRYSASMKLQRKAPKI